MQININTFNLFLQACSLSNSAASVRTFQGPEETLEESLVARGVNTEGYSFLGKTSSLGTLSRVRSVHVANSKFYVRGTCIACLLKNISCTEAYHPNYSRPVNLFLSLF